ASQLEAYRQAHAEWLGQTAKLREELHQIERNARVIAAGERRMKFPAVVLEAIDTDPVDRTAYQRQLAYWSERQMEIKPDVVNASTTEEQKPQGARLLEQLAEWDKKKPQPPSEVAGMVVEELTDAPPATHRLAGGSYDKPLEEVSPGFLSVLRSEGNANIVSPHSRTSGRRTALALWLTDPSNPLTPRVIVNRVWQGHF